MSVVNAITIQGAATYGGDADAQYKYGRMFYTGRISMLLREGKNYEEALKWFNLAAEQGHTDAQNTLGKMYYKGEGTSKDYVLAYKCFKIASSQKGNDSNRKLKSLSKKMSPEQIEKAEKLTKEWQPKPWEDLKKIMNEQGVS